MDFLSNAVVVKRCSDESMAECQREYVFQINICNKLGEESSFMVAEEDLKKLSDVEAIVMGYDPELNVYDLCFYYYDRNGVVKPMASSVDFGVFLKQRVDHHVYVLEMPAFARSFSKLTVVSSESLTVFKFGSKTKLNSLENLDWSTATEFHFREIELPTSFDSPKDVKLSTELDLAAATNLDSPKDVKLSTEPDLAAATNLDSPKKLDAVTERGPILSKPLARSASFVLSSCSCSTSTLPINGDISPWNTMFSCKCIDSTKSSDNSIDLDSSTSSIFFTNVDPTRTSDFWTSDIDCSTSIGSATNLKCFSTSDSSINSDSSTNSDSFTNLDSSHLFAFVFTVLLLSAVVAVVIVTDFSELSRRVSHSENADSNFDKLTKFMEAARRYCNNHQSALPQVCQSVISDFLSFMSPDSVTETSK